MLSAFSDDQSLPSLMAQFAVPDMGVTVVEERKIESRGYGVKKVDGEAVTPETLFQACSISKPVTAVAVVRLAQEGVLDHDEDVNGYLTSWKVPIRTTSRAWLSSFFAVAFVGALITAPARIAENRRAAG